MHFASLKKSARLRRTLDVMEWRKGQWLTTRDLIVEAHICAVNSVIAELRANGCDIQCEQQPAETGERRWAYRLKSAPEGWRKAA